MYFHAVWRNNYLRGAAGKARNQVKSAKNYCNFLFGVL
jgi:hypothetical protein